MYQIAPTKILLQKDTIRRAFIHMVEARELSYLFDREFKTVSKYVHATSRGHEAIQIALGMLLKSTDFVSPYYRDDALLLAIGMQPYDLILQLLAKDQDPFSGGRTYYSHPSLKDEDKPKIIHQSSATGMQAIPCAGIAMGIQYREKMNLQNWDDKEPPIAVCSIGDASMTEGEVSEALQMAALKQFPLLFLVQDNGWNISATAKETRAMDAHEYARGFPGIETVSIDGSDFRESYSALTRIVDVMRKERRPFLLHASVPLLNHHTSGVRKKWYRDDLEEHSFRDPYPQLRDLCEEMAINVDQIENAAKNKVALHFQRAFQQSDPDPASIYRHVYAETPIQVESGKRSPAGNEEKVMVDCALLAVQQILRKNSEALLYGQDVGGRLGGVFREAANLAKQFGDNRVFNTAIQEAFIMGSTVGMSAVGLKPIVEVQFADYIWPGLNQLFAEVSRSNYLSNGKWPVSMVLRVPCGAYGSGGPFHSSSVESVVARIKGVKIAYPSCGADLFGLLNSAYQDPNPVVVFEHKGLYWSKINGTENARSILPSEDYVIPFGKGRMVQEASNNHKLNGQSVLVVSYGMGIHWSIKAAKRFPDQVGILDLRTLEPLDENLIRQKVREYHKVMVVTEESKTGSFAQALAGSISESCFHSLDAPVKTIGALDIPAIPLNENLEKVFLPSSEKILDGLHSLLSY